MFLLWDKEEIIREAGLSNTLLTALFLGNKGRMATHMATRFTALALLLVSSALLSQGALIIYDDGLQNNYNDLSWNVIQKQLDNTNDPRTGVNCILAQLSNNGALSLGSFTTPFTGASSIDFYVRGAQTGLLSLRLAVENAPNTWQWPGELVGDYASGFSDDEWVYVSIPNINLNLGWNR